MERNPKKISLKSWYNDLTKSLEFLDPLDKSYVLLTLILGIFIIYVFYKFSSSAKRKTVALLGLCDAGKTQLFSRLCYNADVLTVTSIKQSSGTVNLNNKKFTLHDLPGHDRIRYVTFDKVKNQLKAIVFMVDASTIHENIKDVAEFLYNVFCDDVIQSLKPNVLIVCNKQDVASAKGAPVVKSNLEKEINLLRITKSNQLRSVGEGGNNNSFLGYRKKDFEFGHLKPIKVTFAEAVTEGGQQIEEVEKWLTATM